MGQFRVSPKEFMRARRPERFSDSVTVTNPTLERPFLEYHLDTLTNRKEESDFERFALALAKLEICPNLIPQTGPTGGGDSRTDSETYPVASNLSIGWYIGSVSNAASERWAFAFSAKRDWRSKIRSDVQKIVDTARGYAKIFFMSNQYIPDKSRAEVCDDLRAKHSIDVRILDRTWILDKVFGNGHQEMAIRTLGIDLPIRSEKRKGPRDTKREIELEDVEKSILSALAEGRHDFRLAEDCIRAMILSRELEKPADYTEGRIRRAERVAYQWGTHHQKVEAEYNGAWTAFWWLENLELMLELYAKVETLVNGSENPYHLELLFNLWTLLQVSASNGDVNEDRVNLREHTTTLTRELERMRADNNRPSASLQARTLLLQMQLQLNLASGKSTDEVLQSLEEVVTSCSGLVGYPLKPLVDIISEIGAVFTQSPAYGQLFETTLKIAGLRQQEISCAEMLVKRGTQQLADDLPYEAIRQLGRALGLLGKEESKEQFARALYLCGCAYERAGLFWAAHGTLVTAASVSVDEFHKYGSVTQSQVACFRRLKWVELQLGRLPHTLAWHELELVTEKVLRRSKQEPTEPEEEQIMYDAMLAILLLKTGLDGLVRLSRLPDVLRSLHLDFSAIALMYALGHEDKIPSEFFENRNKSQGQKELFALWRDQPGADELPEEALLCDQELLLLTSRVLGCSIKMEVDNLSPCREIAEWILAALESFLSTGMPGLISREPKLSIRVALSKDETSLITHTMTERGGLPHLDVTCRSFDPDAPAPDEVSRASEQVMEIIVSIVSRLVVSSEVLQVMERLLRDEKAMDRAISFTCGLTVTGNVLGHSRKNSVTDWLDPKFKQYPIKRAQPWDADTPVQKRNKRDRGEKKPSRDLDKGEPDVRRISHRQVSTRSLIRESLWAKAGWHGFAFCLMPGRLPILGLVFRDGKSGSEIFGAWRNELGDIDTEERLRITLIRRIDCHKPHSYRVVIGSNFDEDNPTDDLELIVTMSRMCTMEPSSSVNLDNFLTAYRWTQKYWLAPCRVDADGPEPLMDLAIGKTQLNVREAWEIGRHDIDGVGIMPEDEPMIPVGQGNPPVTELLQWKRNLLQAGSRDGEGP